MFDYSCVSGSPSTCPAGSTDYPRIVFVGTTLYLDASPGTGPAERKVSSGVYLRNQNEAPSASFSATPQTPAGSRRVFLNASASSDPEGRTLHYYWYKGSGTPQAAVEDPCGGGGAGGPTFIGQGITLNYAFPAADASPQTIQLVVKDPGCLANTQTKSVTIP